MDADIWARTSFRITGKGLSQEALVSELGTPADVVRGDTWIWDVEKSSDQPIQEQAQELERFLVGHKRFLREIASSSEITVNIGWSPRVPQDGVGFTPTLISLLGEFGALLLIDTYIDEDSPRGDSSPS